MSDLPRRVLSLTMRLLPRGPCTAAVDHAGALVATAGLSPSIQSDVFALCHRVTGSKFVSVCVSIFREYLKKNLFTYLHRFFEKIFV